MAGSVRAESAPHKDEIGAENVPKPGPELEAAIVGGARAGCPVGFVPIGLPAPLMEFTPGPEPGVVYPIWLALPQPMALAWFVAAVDFDRSRWRVTPTLHFVFDKKPGVDKPRDRVRADYTIAAYNADIRGSRRHHEDRDLRRDVKHGRRLLAACALWPWAVFGPRGSLPRDWRRHPFTALAWEHWRCGQRASLSA
jgi:hypothetical protein